MIEILMPFYGDPALLRIAVESVLAQESPDWRLVVVDNHYPDPAPGKWVTNLGDPRITYIRNKMNLGVSGNLRRCLELSTGPYLVIMGADDVMHPNYVATMSQAMLDHPEATMIQPRVQVLDELGRACRPLADRVKVRLGPASGKDHVLAGPGLASSLLRGNWAYFPAITWRRAAIAERTFRADMETVFDLDLLMRLVMSGSTFVLLDAQAFTYRRHGSSISSLTAIDTARFKEEARLYAELGPRLRELGWMHAAGTARLHPSSRLHALSLVPRAARSRKWRVAMDLLRHAAGRVAQPSRVDSVR